MNRRVNSKLDIYLKWENYSPLVAGGLKIRCLSSEISLGDVAGALV